MKKINIAIYASVLAVFLAGLGIIHIQKAEIARLRAVKPKVDTLVIRDSIKVIEPVFVKEYVDAPIYIPVVDTLLIEHNDTTYISLPHTVREYRDSSYFARVSGYDPRLEEIEVYYNTKYVIAETKVPTIQKKFDFVALEGGFEYDSQVMLPVTLNFGYANGIFEAKAGGGYDFLTRSPVVKTSLALRLKW